MESNSPEDATLIDVLIDGFEKNEVMYGFHWRDLPMGDEGAALRKFVSFVDEATRWKGPPTGKEEGSDRRLAAWPDLEIRQVGRGLMVRVRAPRFSQWWHERETWKDDPMGPIFEWIASEQDSK